MARSDVTNKPKRGRKAEEAQGSAVPKAELSALNEVGDKERVFVRGFIWRGSSGETISCLEKIKILEENLAELRQVYLDALEDALLLGVSRKNFLENFAKSMELPQGKEATIDEVVD